VKYCGGLQNRTAEVQTWFMRERYLPFSPTINVCGAYQNRFNSVGSPESGRLRQ